MAELKSYEKFNYLLRPSKQVERKLIVETMHRLSCLGYDASNYTYLGLGSVYYADFIVFHKYLYIDRMICAESEKIPKRMEFNRPYDFITLEMKSVAEVIPELDRTMPHLVWLDYDYPLNESILGDTAGLMHVLTAGSVLIVTVDAEPRIPASLQEEGLSEDELINNYIEYMEEQFGKYYSGKVVRAIFTYNSLPEFYAQVLNNQLRENVAKRKDVDMLQLLNFKYSDGAQMLTLGVLIDSKEQLDKVKGSDVSNLDFICSGNNPIVVSVPPLTVREKHWLDNHPRLRNKKGKLPFELQEQMVDNFYKYRRHYPTYYETLV